MKRSDKWAAFSLHAVLLLACGSSQAPAVDGGAGDVAAAPYSDAGPDVPSTKMADAELSDSSPDMLVADASGGDVASQDASTEEAAPIKKSGTGILFGGGSVGSGDLNDTWTFDGTSWTQISVSNPPPARVYAVMATLGNEVVLFGGFPVLGGFLNDTWTFDGTSWTQVSVSNPPPARADAAMATLGNEIVLFGGALGIGTGFLNDTWKFDGTSWVLGSVAGILGAILGAFVGLRCRTWLARAFRRDRPAALLEDAVAIAGAVLIVALA